MKLTSKIKLFVRKSLLDGREVEVEVVKLIATVQRSL